MHHWHTHKVGCNLTHLRRRWQAVHNDSWMHVPPQPMRSVTGGALSATPASATVLAASCHTSGATDSVSPRSANRMMTTAIGAVRVFGAIRVAIRGAA